MIKNTHNKDTKKTEAESSPTQTSSSCRGGLSSARREAPAARAEAGVVRPLRDEEQVRRAASGARGEEGDSRRAARPPDGARERQQQRQQDEPSPHRAKRKEVLELFPGASELKVEPASSDFHLPFWAVRKHFTEGAVDEGKALAVTEQRRHDLTKNTVFEENKKHVDKVSFKDKEGNGQLRFVSRGPLDAFQCYKAPGEEEWSASHLGPFHAVFFEEGHLDVDFYKDWFVRLGLSFPPLPPSRPPTPTLAAWIVREGGGRLRACRRGKGIR